MPLDRHATVSTSNCDPAGRPPIKQAKDDALANTSQLEFPVEALQNAIPDVSSGEVIEISIEDVEFA